MDVSLWAWLAVLVVILAMLALDLFMHRDAHAAFAILGLQAMYFLLADLMHRFVYLKAGLALVLIWVGIKMLLKIDVYHVPTTVSLAVVASIIAASIVLSLVRTRGQARHAVELGSRAPFRVRDEDGGVLAGHEAEYGDDTPAEVVGGTARRRARLGLAGVEENAR